MKKETVQKRAFNYMRKHYPLLRTGLIMYFVEVILLTYENFKFDSDNGDTYFKNDTDILNYSIEINTCDKYHSMINDYNNNITEKEKQQYSRDYVNMMIKYNLGVK